MSQNEDDWKFRILLVIPLILIIASISLLTLSVLQSEALEVQKASYSNLSINDCFLKAKPPWYEEGSESYHERIDLLLVEISSRESGGDPTICNQEFGCSAGAGLTGIIPSTLKDCEEALGRELNVFDKEDNLACAKWLLKTRGIWPWEEWSGPYAKILVELDLEDLW